MEKSKTNYFEYVALPSEDDSTKGPYVFRMYHGVKSIEKRPDPVIEIKSVDEASINFDDYIMIREVVLPKDDKSIRNIYIAKKAAVDQHHRFFCETLKFYHPEEIEIESTVEEIYEKFTLRKENG